MAEEKGAQDGANSIEINFINNLDETIYVVTTTTAGQGQRYKTNQGPFNNYNVLPYQGVEPGVCLDVTPPTADYSLTATFIIMGETVSFTISRPPVGKPTVSFAGGYESKDKKWHLEEIKPGGTAIGRPHVTWTGKVLAGPLPTPPTR